MAHFKKSIPIFNTVSKSNIDNEAGIIKNVVIVNGGRDKVGDNIDSTFLSQIADQGNAQSTGVKARFGHPNMCDDALGTYIGRYKNFSITGESVTADLHLDLTAKNSPKGDLYSYVLAMANTNPDMFGNSIVFSPDQEQVVEEKDDNGVTIKVNYIRCKNFVASDVVDSPAATNSLFKSESDFAAKATDFLDNNLEIFELLHKSPNLLTDFLTKYSNYKNQMSNKNTDGSDQLNLIQKSIAAIKDLLTPKEKVKSLELATVDGQMVTVETDGDNVAVGDSCTIAGAPAEGDYILANGNTITVAGGKVTEVIPTETPATPKVVAESASDEEIKSLKASNEELAAKLAAQEKQFAEVQKNLDELTVKLKATKIDFTIETGAAASQAMNKTVTPKVKSVYELAKEKEEERKKNQTK